MRAHRLQAILRGGERRPSRTRHPLPPLSGGGTRLLAAHQELGGPWPQAGGGGRIHGKKAGQKLARCIPLPARKDLLLDPVEKAFQGGGRSMAQDTLDRFRSQGCRKRLPAGEKPLLQVGEQRGPVGKHLVGSLEALHGDSPGHHTLLDGRVTALPVRGAEQKDAIRRAHEGPAILRSDREEPDHAATFSNGMECLSRRSKRLSKSSTRCRSPSPSRPRAASTRKPVYKS